MGWLREPDILQASALRGDRKCRRSTFHESEQAINGRGVFDQHRKRSVPAFVLRARHVVAAHTHCHRRIVPYCVFPFRARAADGRCLLEPLLYCVERLLGLPPLA